jgi:hypothetical protein
LRPSWTRYTTLPSFRERNRENPIQLRTSRDRKEKERRTASASPQVERG